MRTIITYKSVDGKPEQTFTYVGLVAQHDLEEDLIDLLDYNGTLSLAGIPLLSIKRIIWDELETEADGEIIRAIDEELDEDSDT